MRSSMRSDVYSSGFEDEDADPHSGKRGVDKEKQRLLGHRNSDPTGSQNPQNISGLQNEVKDLKLRLSQSEQLRLKMKTVYDQSQEKVSIDNVNALESKVTDAERELEEEKKRSILALSDLEAKYIYKHAKLESAEKEVLRRLIKETEKNKQSSEIVKTLRDQIEKIQQQHFRKGRVEVKDTWRKCGGSADDSKKGKNEQKESMQIIMKYLRDEEGVRIAANTSKLDTLEQVVRTLWSRVHHHRHHVQIIEQLFVSYKDLLHFTPSHCVVEAIKQLFVAYEDQYQALDSLQWQLENKIRDKQIMEESLNAEIEELVAERNNLLNKLKSRAGSMQIESQDYGRVREVEEELETAVYSKTKNEKLVKHRPSIRIEESELVKQVTDLTDQVNQLEEEKGHLGKQVNELNKKLNRLELDDIRQQLSERGGVGVTAYPLSSSVTREQPVVKPSQSVSVQTDIPISTISATTTSISSSSPYLSNLNATNPALSDVIPPPSTSQYLTHSVPLSASATPQLTAVNNRLIEAQTMAPLNNSILSHSAYNNSPHLSLHERQQQNEVSVVRNFLPGYTEMSQGVTGNSSTGEGRVSSNSNPGWGHVTGNQDNLDLPAGSVNVSQLLKEKEDEISRLQQIISQQVMQIDRIRLESASLHPRPSVAGGHANASERLLIELELTNSQLKREVERLEDDVSEGKRRVEEAQRQKEMAESQQSSTYHQLVQKESSVMRVETELVHSKKECAELHNEVERFRRQSQSVEQERRVVEHQIAELKHRLDNSNDQLCKEKQISLKLDGDFNRMRAVRDSLDVEKRSLADSLCGEQRSVEKLREKLFELEESKKKVEEDMSRTRYEVENVREELRVEQKESKTLTRLCEKLRRELEDAESRVVESGNEVERVEGRYKQIVEQGKEVNVVEKERFEVERDALLQEIEKLRSRLRETEISLAESQAKSEHFEAIKTELDKARGDIRDLHSACSSLREESSGRSGEVRCLEEEKAMCKREEMRLGREMEVLKEGKERLEGVVEEMKVKYEEEVKVMRNKQVQKMEEMVDVKDRLMREVSEYKCKLSELESKLDCKKQVEVGLVEQISSQKSVIDRLNINLNSSNTERKVVEEKLKIFEKDLDEDGKERKARIEETFKLKQNLSHLEGERSRLEKEKRMCEDELRLSVGRCRALEKTVEQVKEQSSGVEKQLMLLNESSKTEKLSVTVQHQETHKKLEAKCSSLEHELKRSKLKVDEMSKEVLKIELEGKSRTDEMFVMRERIREMEREKCKTEEMLMKIRDSYQVAQVQGEGLTERSKYLELEINRLRNESKKKFSDGDRESENIRIHKLLVDFQQNIQRSIDVKQKSADHLENLNKAELNKVRELERDLLTERTLHTIKSMELQSVREENNRLRDQIHRVKHRWSHASSIPNVQEMEWVSSMSSHNKSQSEMVSEMISRHDAKAKEIMSESLRSVSSGI